MVRRLIVLMAVTLVGCATMGTATDLPSGDTKNWITYRVEVSDQIVQFTIPPGVNNDFLDPPVLQRIDLQQHGLFDETGQGPRILSRHWDYRGSPFALVDGTLVAKILLIQSEKPLSDLSALQAAISERQALLHKKDVNSGEYTGPPNPPTSFEFTNVGGRQGFKVHYTTTLPDYAVAIDDHHYLIIYLDSSGVARPGWREDARAAANAIFQSLSIEKH